MGGDEVDGVVVGAMEEKRTAGRDMGVAGEGGGQTVKTGRGRGGHWGGR